MASSLSSAVEPGQTDPQDRAALQGTWRAIEATSNGEPPPAGMLEKLTLVFAGDKFSIMGSAPTGYKIDASFKPAHIDFLNSRHQVGIYELKATRSGSALAWMAIGPRRFAPGNTPPTLTCR